MEQNIKVAVDAVVFGYDKGTLFVLLIQQKFGSQHSYWALPGGLVQEQESLIHAVKRELKEETNITVNFLEQLYTFGDDITRDSRNRVISVAYMALVDPSKLHIKADTDAEDVAWMPIDKIPNLAFDHNEIIQKGIQRLKSKLTYQPIGFDLLPSEFLFSDLENLSSTILEKDLDRRNFRKKIFSFQILEECETLRSLKSGRPAKLFRFNVNKYKELEDKGFHFEIKFA